MTHNASDLLLLLAQDPGGAPWRANLAERFAELPPLLGGHLLLSSLAVGLGILLSVPAGIFASRSRTWRGPLLTFAGIVQTIPGLALLALMVPLLGGLIGFVPALVALTLYSILPILRNTVTGIAEVDSDLVEAARAMGMTEGQVLRKVQLPLAAPVMLAGVRTASVWVIGTATLATPVGAASLGNYIFMGLQTRNHIATIFGCVLAALLAILFDGLIRAIESAVRWRSALRGALAGAGLLAILAGGLAPVVLPRLTAFDIGLDSTSTVEPASAGAPSSALSEPVTLPLAGETFTTGSKPFSESYILADVLARRLEAAGAEIDNRPNMGSTILFDALRNNTVDAYVDYSGTIWSTIMKRDDAAGRLPVLIEVAAHLKEEYGVICVGPLGFENAYALAMHKDRATELRIRTISDLARAAGQGQLMIGGDPEIFGRPEWTRVRDAYGLGALKTIGMQSIFMYEAVRDGKVDVITAYSSDGRIAAYDLVVLDDPQQAFPPYDAVLLVSPEAAARPGVIEALWPLVNSIPDELMRAANMRVDVEGASPAAAAAWLDEQALLRGPGEAGASDR